MLATTIPADLADELQALAVEIARIHESVLYSAQGQFEQAKYWRLVNWVLGSLVAALAAVAGTTGLTEHFSTTIVSLIVLAAAALGAVATTINAGARRTQAQAAANAYLELQTAARQLLTVDLSRLNYDQARERLSELSARRDEVNKAAEPPGWYAYWRAGRNVRKGRQSHAVDAEQAKEQ